MSAVPQVVRLLSLQFPASRAHAFARRLQGLHYFQQGRAPSADDIGRLLGCSGSSASPLKKLVRALRGAECRCMDHKQRGRQLAGHAH